MRHETAETVGIPRRRALDGLRAVAVAAVLLYHGNVSWARGGFLGVDLFFVLSGFLIMSLLLAEQRRTGRLRLRAFWGARARRLLPAVALLLVAVLWVLPAFGVRWGGRVTGDAWATAAYASNWWFIASKQSYVDQAAGPSPLLHTWSLAIEEQWYLVLPLVLVLSARMRRPTRFLATLLALAAVASVALAWWLRPAGGDPSRAFFGTDTRAQELLVGALAALWVGHLVWRPEAAGRPRGISWLAALGAAGLIGCAAVAGPESDWLYRGGLLLVAVACALLVVGAAAAPRATWGLHRLLAWRPLVAVGLVSYGVYLWHWPVYLLLDADRTGLAGPSLLALRVATTLLVATASYHLVEMPVRRQVWRQWQGIPARWVAAGAGALVLAALVRPVGPAAPAADSLVSLARLAPDHPAPGTFTPSRTTRPQPGRSAHRILLVGDSQALSLYAAVRDRPGAGLTVGLVTRFGCGVVPYVATAEGQVLRPQRPLCTTWAQRRASEIAAAGADVGVLFAGDWEQYDRYLGGRAVSFRDPQWLRLTARAYRGVLAEMHRHVRHLAVVLDHCHRAPPVALPVQTLYQWGRYPPVVNDGARVAAVNRAARLAAAAFRDVAVLDVNAFLCGHGYTGERAGVRLRTDGVHWTTGGAQIVWRWMAPRLRAVGDGSPLR